MFMKFTEILVSQDGSSAATARLFDLYMACSGVASPRHSTRCHPACCWSNVASSIAVWIVIRSGGASNTSLYHLETKPLRLLDHVHGTVYRTSSLTTRHLSPSRNTSRLIVI